jgi:hypothetical protein
VFFVQLRTSADTRNQSARASVKSKETDVAKPECFSENAFGQVSESLSDCNTKKHMLLGPACE